MITKSACALLGFLEFEMFWWKRFWMTPTWLPKSSKGSFWITRLVNSMCQSWHESTTQQVPSQVVVGIPNSPKLPIQTTHSSFYSALKSSNISNLNYHAAERLWVASWLLIYMKINATSRILTDPNSSLLTEGPTHEPKPRLIHGNLTIVLETKHQVHPKSVIRPGSKHHSFAVPSCAPVKIRFLVA